MSRDSSDDNRRAWCVRGVYAVFFCSGALALMYEVVWLRRLLLVFGNTVHAASTVVAVFFGGLAIGSWFFGRLVDRHDRMGLLWYAACEAGIGLYAFVTVPLFRVAEQLYLPWYRASGFSQTVLVGASLLGSVGILLIPTILMGGTFPLVSRFLIRTAHERGEKIASLYSLNTIGAVWGTVVVYYGALQHLGWLATLQCIGLSNLLLAVAARALHRHFQQIDVGAVSPASVAGSSTMGTLAASGATSRISRLDTRWLLVVFGLSGFSAMVYEVAWTRSLSLILGSSVYAFCLILATFLGGMVMGSFVARLLLRSRPAMLAYVVLLEVGLATSGLFSIPMFASLSDWFVTLWPLFGHSFAGLSWLQVLLSMSVMALPTFCMGLLFPIVSELVTRGVPQFGSRLGSAYAVNTLGGILGAALSGFWLIWRVGIAWTLCIAALVNLAAGLCLYLRVGSLKIGARALLATAVFAMYLWLGSQVFVPSWQRQVMAAGAYLEPGLYATGSVRAVESQHELLFYRESLNATVSVHRDPRNNSLFLKVGGKTDASTGMDMGTQVLAAHLPLLLHPHPSRVLVIGLGSGVTLGSAGRYPVSVLDCAEIEPAVVEGARYFAQTNYHIHDDPRAHIHVTDGRHFLLASQAQYDVSISEPSNPWMAGVANLFTREFYQLAKQRLAPGGIMCQWVQLYRIFPADVKLVLKTFQETFPYVSVWSTIPGDIVLIGSLEPHQVDYQRLKEQFAVPAIKADLARVALTHPLALLELFCLGPDQVKQLVADVPGLHEDDRPDLEFNAPKALYADRSFRVNYQGLGQLKAARSIIAPTVSEADQDAAFYLAVGKAYRFRQELDEAIKAFEHALGLEPDNGVAAVQLGELYLQRGWPLKAQEVLTKAIEHDPDFVEARQWLARVLWRQGKEEEALAQYQQAAGTKAADAVLAAEIGATLKAAKRWREAEEYLRVAVAGQDDRSSSASFVDLAEVYQELKQFDDAAAVLTVAIARRPYDVALPLLLAQVRLDQGRQADAKPLFEQVLKQAPSRAQAWVGLGTIAMGQREFQRAAYCLKTGLRYDPYNAKALDMLHTINFAPRNLFKDKHPAQEMGPGYAREQGIQSSETRGS